MRGTWQFDMGKFRISTKFASLFLPLLKIVRTNPIISNFFFYFWVFNLEFQTKNDFHLQTKTKSKLNPICRQKICRQKTISKELIYKLSEKIHIQYNLFKNSCYFNREFIKNRFSFWDFPSNELDWSSKLENRNRRVFE